MNPFSADRKSKLNAETQSSISITVTLLWKLLLGMNSSYKCKYARNLKLTEMKQNNKIQEATKCLNCLALTANSNYTVSQKKQHCFGLL